MCIRDRFSKGFGAIGAALAKGENAFDAFAGVVKGVIGDMAGALGDSMIKQGLAISVNPYAGGPSVGGPIIGAGAALKVLAGALGASGGAGGGGGGGSSSFSSAPIESSTALTSDFAEPEIQASGPSVALTVEGNIFNNDETKASILDFLNEQLTESGGTINNASFA